MVDTEIAGPRVPLEGCPHVAQAQVSGGGSGAGMVGHRGDVDAERADLAGARVPPMPQLNVSVAELRTRESTCI